MLKLNKHIKSLIITMTNLYPEQPGIYCFWNKISNKIYVGSSINLNTRINQHLKNKTSNQHLQNAINCYGINSFCITYWILKTKEEAINIEQILLDCINNKNILCYNIHDKAKGGRVGTKANHRKLTENGGGIKAITIFALEIKQPEIIYTFETSVEAANNTKVPQGNISHSCKNAKPYNSESGRWLFSNISVYDLNFKFETLLPHEIKGSKKRLSI